MFGDPTAKSSVFIVRGEAEVHWLASLGLGNVETNTVAAYMFTCTTNGFGAGHTFTPRNVTL